MNVGSLFAGIGGFDLAFQRAGFDLAWHVEWDEACQRVLTARFSGGVQPLSGKRGSIPRDGGGEVPLAEGERQDVESRSSNLKWAGGPYLFSDVREVGAHNLSAVDVLVGGFPCQDVSVAGRRSGLAGERSGLWWEFHRIISELTPGWVVIENVPGLLSSNAGRDMGAILRSLGNLGYGWAYRILDAQWSGLAQRRKRVFIVGCLGDPARAAQVLLEPEGCPGNPPTRRAPGARASTGPEGRPPVARRLRATGNDSHAEDLDTYVTDEGGGVASTLGNSSGRRGHKVSAEDAAGNHLVMAPAFSKRPGQQIATRDDGTSFALTGTEPPRVLAEADPIVIRTGGDYDDPTIVLDDVPFLAANPMSDREMVIGYTIHSANSCAEERHAFETEVTKALDTTGGFATSQGGTVVAHTLNSKKPSETRGDGNDNLVVAHTLSAEGADASEDGTGRGTPLVAIPLDMRHASDSEHPSGVGTPGTGVGEDGDPSFGLGVGAATPAVAFDTYNQTTEDVSQTLRDPHGTFGDALPAVAFVKAQKAHDADDCERWEEADAVGADSAHSTTSATAIGFFPTDGRDQRAYEEQSPALKVGTGLDIPTGPAVQSGMLVRRLTPLECERLQGFPDGWTEGQPDSTRYRQLGNAVAVPVVEWIARRIAAVHVQGTVTE